MDFIPEKKINFAFNVPDRTVFENGVIQIPGTGIIGNHASVIPGIKAVSLIIGEGVSVSGAVETEEDLRADIWCKFRDDVTVKRNASLGEFTSVSGKIFVQGDLDIGKEVKLDGGFETHGWVVVRNPLPIMVYLMMYIRALMGIGKSSEEIDKALDDLFDEDEEANDEQTEINLMDLDGSEEMFLLPIGSRISENSLNVPENAIIGRECRLVTDIYASKIIIGYGSEIVGYVRSRKGLCLTENVTIRGDIQAGSRIVIGKGCAVFGDVTGRIVYIHESATVTGNIITSGGARRISDEKLEELIEEIEEGFKETDNENDKAAAKKAKKAESKSKKGKSAKKTGKDDEKSKNIENKNDAGFEFTEIETTPYDPYRKTGIQGMRKVGQLKTSGNLPKSGAGTHHAKIMKKRRKQKSE